MVHSPMQWKHVPVAAALALLLAAPLQVHAANEGSSSTHLSAMVPMTSAAVHTFWMTCCNVQAIFPRVANCCWLNARQRPATWEERWTM